MDWASCSFCRKTCTPAAVAAVSGRSLVWERAGTGVRAVASTSSKINSNWRFYGVAVRVAVVVSGTAFPPTWTNEFRERRAQEYLGIGGRESAALTSCLSVDLWFLCMHHAPRGAAALNFRSRVSGLTPGCAKAPVAHRVDGDRGFGAGGAVLLAQAQVCGCRGVPG